MFIIKNDSFYSLNTLLYAMGTVALVMAIIAYFLDYFFGYAGCTLCHVERILLCVTGIWTICLQFGWGALGMWGIGLSVTCYHLAVQNHWLPLASFCKAAVPSGETLAAQMEDFLSKPSVSCDQVTLKIFGISAVYFLCIFFAIGSIFVVWNTRIKSKPS
ncbi:hypothetical protein P618_200380 [Holospora obtusa F1]|uniref:Disulfide bond formation protein B n=1 Tax=Holospora obtusa F1 TaxID=1399147 RepID=W6TUN1_HOLOB|nr:disulfide bond formation protein B [Holospora obtusa]ETZ07432.1 hypothetical protein P618_200380 [Holospora obtusa F1]